MKKSHFSRSFLSRKSHTSQSLRKIAVAYSLINFMGLAGCTLGVMDHPQKMQLHLDLTPGYLQKNIPNSSSASSSSLATLPALTPPADWSKFTCLAVNVMGSGIPAAASSTAAATYLPGVLNGGFCSYLGITSSPLAMSAASATVDLSIPVSVTSGIVQVLGVFDPKGLYCNQSQTLGAIYPMTSVNKGTALLFELGRTSVSLTSNVQTTVSDTYSVLPSSQQVARLADCENSLSTLLSGFSYASSSQVFTIGTAITALAPTISGATPISYSISPALPSGLVLDSTLGVLSGTPTAISAATAYTVTASNLYGSTSTSLSLQVAGTPIASQAGFSNNVLTIQGTNLDQVTSIQLLNTSNNNTIGFTPTTVTSTLITAVANIASHIQMGGFYHLLLNSAAADTPVTITFDLPAPLSISSGNVGIGTTSPASALSVAGDITSTGTVTATTFVGTFSGGVSLGTVSSIEVTGAGLFDTSLVVGGTGQFNTNVSIGGSLSMNGSIILNRLPVYLAGGNDCNHAIYNNASSPCSLTSPTGNADSEFFNYEGGLIFWPRQTNNPSYFDGSGNLVLQGNVGIGTTTPGAALAVAGNITSTGTISATTFVGTFSGGVSVGSVSSLALTDTNISMTTAGNVGIGTSNATTERLVVSGGAVDIQSGKNSSSDSGLGLSYESYGGRIQSYNNLPVILNPEGNNVGIGNGATNPASLVEIGTNNSFSGRRLRIVGYANSPSTSTGADASLEIGDGGGVFWRVTRNNGNTFQTDMSNTWGIMGGNVGVGVLNPSYTLQVAGSVAGSSAYNNTSDERLKRDIHPLNDSLNKISQLRGVSFHWKTEEYPEMKFSNREAMGVIAQEVEKVFPDAVSQDQKGIRSVAYSMLIAPIIEALKEIYALIQGTEAELAALKAENLALKQDRTVRDAKDAARDQLILGLKNALCSKDPSAEICRP